MTGFWGSSKGLFLGGSLGKCDCVLTVKDVKTSTLCLYCDEDNADESLLLQVKRQDVCNVLSEVLEKW